MNGPFKNFNSVLSWKYAVVKWWKLEVGSAHFRLTKFQVLHYFPKPTSPILPKILHFILKDYLDLVSWKCRQKLLGSKWKFS